MLNPSSPTFANLQSIFFFFAWKSFSANRQTREQLTISSLGAARRENVCDCTQQEHRLLRRREFWQKLKRFACKPAGLGSKRYHSLEQRRRQISLVQVRERQLYMQAKFLLVVHQPGHTCNMQMLFIARPAWSGRRRRLRLRKTVVCCIGAHLGFAASSNICTRFAPAALAAAPTKERKLKVKRLEMPLELYQHLGVTTVLCRSLSAAPRAATINGSWPPLSSPRCNKHGGRSGVPSSNCFSPRERFYFLY